MDLNELLHREALVEEGQETYDAIMRCDDAGLLCRLVLGEAADKSWRGPAWGRLLNMQPTDVPAYVLALEQVAERGDNDLMRAAARRRLSALGSAVEGRPNVFGKSIFNPDLLRYLFMHRDELCLEDEGDLDLMAFAAWDYLDEDVPCSRLRRTMAKRLYALLPQARRDELDVTREPCGWDPSNAKYFLLRRIIERETDVDLLEDAALNSGNNWISSFSLARLTGWSTYQEEDWWSFATYECDRLEGYPKERLGRLLDKMVERGRMDRQTADRLLADAG